MNYNDSMPCFSLSLLLSRTWEPERVISHKGKVTLMHLICGILGMEVIVVSFAASPSVLSESSYFPVAALCASSQFLRVLSYFHWNLHYADVQNFKNGGVEQLCIFVLLKCQFPSLECSMAYFQCFWFITIVEKKKNPWPRFLLLPSLLRFISSNSS